MKERINKKWKCKNCGHVFHTWETEIVVGKVNLLESNLLGFAFEETKLIDSYFMFPYIFCPECHEQATYPGTTDRECRTNYEVLVAIEDVLKYSPDFEEVREGDENSTES